MCEFNTKITIAQLLRLTSVSAKSKIYSPRRGYLSPRQFHRFGNSSYFLVHQQRQNVLLIFGLILLKLMHASNRPVYFRDLGAAYTGGCKLQVAGHCFTKAETTQNFTNANIRPKKQR